MRVVIGVVASMFLATAVSAQTPAKADAPAKGAAAKASGPAKGKPMGTLAQVMRAIYFPNANIIFDVQAVDPAAPSAKKNANEGGASQTFAAIYTGWQVVENAAIALGEAADLLTYPGRLCQNGKPVPVGRADWDQYVATMKKAADEALRVAKTKNREAMMEATNTVSDACSTCHEPYRDAGEADSPNRCTPPSAERMERIRKGQAH
jgi:hypothetical protein